MKGRKIAEKPPAIYSVLNPGGIRPAIDRFPLSPRLPSLAGKVVYFVEASSGPIFMQELAKRLPKYAPGVKTVFQLKPLGVMTDHPETWDEVVQKADAMVSGTVMGASSGAYNVGWIIGVEKRGVPTVGIVARPFGDHYIPLAAELFGMPALRTFNITLLEEERVKADMTETQYKEIISQIIDALTRPLTHEEKKGGKIVPKKQPRIAMTGTYEEVQDYFYKQHWTDGLPIAPPTEKRVKEMLKGTSHALDEIVTAGDFPVEISINTINVEKVAIVGVMAGCKPEYMPVLLAMAEALGKGDFKGLPSPSSQSLMTVVNGPIRNEIGMNCGLNALGPGNIANASIGRFLRLAIIALAGMIPGINDLSAIGNPTRYSFCFPENEEESPWEPLHVSMGYKTDESIVNIFNGGMAYSNVMGPGTIEVKLNAAAQARTGPIFLMTPGMARLYAERGMSKEDVRRHIMEHAVVTIAEGKRSQFIAFMSRAFGGEYDKMSDDTLVPLYEREAIQIIVAGGECGFPTTQAWEYIRPATASVDKWR